jgi:hypothetical protein
LCQQLSTRLVAAIHTQSLEKRTGGVLDATRRALRLRELVQQIARRRTLQARRVKARNRIVRAPHRLIRQTGKP